jgi:hypothetical protein
MPGPQPTRSPKKPGPQESGFAPQFVAASISISNNISEELSQIFITFSPVKQIFLRRVTSAAAVSSV